jgi:F0F1-type ATP synthase membrane subunit c/vacuolar-type H+-ATPase subunit K
MAAERRPTPLMVARIVWAALLASVALYVVVLVVLASTEAERGAPELVALLRTPLLGMAGLQTAIVGYLRHRFLAPASTGQAVMPPETDPGRILSLHVFCWGLGEAIAVFGLVIGLIGREVGATAVFFLWSAALLILLRPQAAYFR